MPSLTLAANGSFVWTGTPEEHAQTYALRGWCRTTAAPPGMIRCYTGELNGRPCHNPYAALYLADCADEAARAALEPFLRDYEASFALDAPESVAPMPPGEALLPFQRAGVDYALRRQHAMFGDPMGLGKSIQALAVCNARRSERILILCPAAVAPQWVQFVRRWLIPLRRGYRDAVVIITRYVSAPPPSARVVICSYDRAKQPKVTAALAAEVWDHVILDEAHYLRHHSTQRSKAILGAYAGDKYPGIIKKAAHILALTGTPLPNRPREAYALARALDWESIGFMSKQAFEDRFNPTRVFRVQKSDGTEAFVLHEKTGRLPELQARLRCGFMVRREKAAAAPQMPSKMYDVILCDTDATREVVRAERALDLDIDHLEAIPLKLTGHVARLRRQMAIAMLPIVQEFISETLAAEDGKLVVFAHHLELIGKLAHNLSAAKPVVVTGSVSPGGRMEAARTFQRDRACRLFIGQIQAAGTGIDGLQEVCSTAVFAEPSWVPAENEQAIDRLHRVGQREPVLARFLVAEGSLNARIVARYVEKSRIAHIALDAR